MNRWLYIKAIFVLIILIILPSKVSDGICSDVRARLRVWYMNHQGGLV